MNIQFPFSNANTVGARISVWAGRHGEALVTFKKTRPAGQPAAVSDLPPLRCCALPVRSRTSQIPRCKISSEIAPQNKNTTLGVKQNGKETAIRRRHGAEEGRRALGGPHRHRA